MFILSVTSVCIFFTIVLTRLCFDGSCWKSEPPGLRGRGINGYGGRIPKRERSDEYDSHVRSSGTVINYLRCLKASWRLQPFLIPPREIRTVLAGLLSRTELACTLRGRPYIQNINMTDTGAHFAGFH